MAASARSRPGAAMEAADRSAARLDMGSAASAEIRRAERNIVELDAFQGHLFRILACGNNHLVQRAKVVAAGNNPLTIQTERHPLPVVAPQFREREAGAILSISLRIHMCSLHWLTTTEVDYQ